MARLWSSGAELNSITGDVEWTSNTPSPPIDTTIKRSGAYSIKISSLGSAIPEAVQYEFASAVNSGPFYFRWYLYVVTAPSAENLIINPWGGPGNNWSLNSSYRITLDNSRLLRLYDEDGQIGSASSALSLETWYQVELYMDVTGAGGSHVLRARVDGVEFAGASNRNI